MLVGDYSRADAATKTDVEGRLKVEGDPNRYGRSDVTFCLLIRDAERKLALALDIDEETAPLDLRLEPGLTFSGRAECDGRPVTTATPCY